MSDLPDGRVGSTCPSSRGRGSRNWRSGLTMPNPHYTHTQARSAGTRNTFLLMPSAVGVAHGAQRRIVAVPLGGPLLLEVGRTRQHQTHLLGADILAGEQPQIVVPPGHWQRPSRDDEPAWSAVW